MSDLAMSLLRQARDHDGYLQLAQPSAVTDEGTATHPVGALLSPVLLDHITVLVSSGFGAVESHESGMRFKISDLGRLHLEGLDAKASGHAALIEAATRIMAEKGGGK